MHMDTRSTTFSYEMGVAGSKVLRLSEEERVLGENMHKSTKPSGQYAEASRNANSTLGMTRRTSHQKQGYSTEVLYISYTYSRRLGGVVGLKLPLALAAAVCVPYTTSPLQRPRTNHLTLT